MLINFLSAIALVFVLEGIMPFAMPDVWRRLLQRMQAKDDKSLRIAGFISMIAGVILLSIIHQFID